MSRKDFNYSLNLILTTKCPNHCRFCYQKDTHFKRIKPATMSLSTAKRAVRFYLNLKHNNFGKSEIDFIGGEPLLERETIRAIVDFTREIKAGNHKRMIFTNAVLLNAQDLIFFKKNKIWLRINLLGLYRNFSHFRKSYLLKELSKYRHKDGVLVLSPFLSAESSRIASFISFLKFKRIFCILEHNDKIWNKENLGNTYSVFKAIKNGISPAVEIKIIQPLPEISTEKIDIKKSCFCQRFRNKSITVMPNGDVFPCMIGTIIKSARDYNMFKMGNIMRPYSLLDGIKRLHHLSYKFRDYHSIPCLPLKIYDRQKELFELLQKESSG